MKTSIQTLIIGGMLAIAVSGPVHATALLKPSSGDTQALSAKSLSINSKINGAFARTTLTTIYKNPNRQRIEADFIYSAPKGAVVTGFAYWFGKEKVVARVVEKNRAARIYEYITTRQQDPALIEMIDKNTFRARIFPIEANQDLKIEIQLAQTLESTPNGLNWNYPLQEETKGGALEKFEMHLQSQDKVTSNFGEFSNGKLDLERTNFSADKDLNIQVAQNRSPLRMSLLARRESSASDGFFALSIVPSTPVAAPRFKMSGVSTYDVLVPTMKRLEAGAPFLVFGRYKGSAKAVVALNNQSVALDFGVGVEQNNAASKLWAQKRIETLSESEKNRFQVVDLSSRFGIVSKWTSWLAIPSAERERFQEEVDKADRKNAGRAYAQAIARGDLKTAKAQQKIFAVLNKKLDDNERIADYVSSELDIISELIVDSKEEKVPAAKVQQWKLMQQVLMRNGARRNTATEAVYESYKEELDRLLPLFVSEVELGRESGERARKLESRLRYLSDSRAMRRFEEDDYFEESLAEYADERAQTLANVLIEERADNRLTPARKAHLTNRMKHLLPLAYEEVTMNDYIVSAQQQIVIEKTNEAQYQAVQQLREGVPYEKVVREFDEQWAVWEKRVQGTKLNKQQFTDIIRSTADERLTAEILAKHEALPENIRLAQVVKSFKDNHSYSWRLRRAYGQRADEVATDLLKEQLANGEKSPLATKLKVQVDYLSGEAGENKDEIILKAATQERADIASQLTSHVLKKTEDSTNAKTLQSRLDKAIALYPGYWRGFDYWQNHANFEKFYDLDTAWQGRAHETAYQLLEAQEKEPGKVDRLKNELEKLAVPAKNTPDSFLEWEKARRDANEPMISTEEYYRVRPGDPLISVIAPQNSRQVIAILPSGEVKRLVWNAANKAFEARFDVPAHAVEGDYAVKIIIVGADNSRRQLTLHFAVDTLAPDGKGALKFENGIAKIRLETDENTDRVNAFLPWDERVELRRDESGIFGGELQVPAEWQNKEASVRFVLTDKAHNRSEIWVSP